MKAITVRFTSSQEAELLKIAERKNTSVADALRCIFVDYTSSTSALEEARAEHKKTRDGVALLGKLFDESQKQSLRYLNQIWLQTSKKEAQE